MTAFLQPLLAPRCLHQVLQQSAVAALHSNPWLSGAYPVQQQQRQPLHGPQLRCPFSTQASSSVTLSFSTADGQPLSDSGLETVRLLKRYNIAIPRLTGSVILAKVVKADEHSLLVDPGYYSLTRIPKAEVASAQPCTADGSPVEREAAQGGLGLAARFCPGEYVRVRLSHLFTPFGDVQLDPVQMPASVRDKVLWEELADRMSKGVPVQGRLLNRASTKRHGALVHGWAVGVAGYVAFVQDGNVAPDKMQQIGTLQEFYIHYMDKPRLRIFLSMSRLPSQQNIYEYTI